MGEGGPKKINQKGGVGNRTVTILIPLTYTKVIEACHEDIGSFIGIFGLKSMKFFYERWENIGL